MKGVDSHKRRPLVRRARQTGKTYIVNEFGKLEFKELIYLNFERNPEYKDIFNSNIPAEIAEKITLYNAKKPEPGKTLLFIDEIQECPEAIISLRYFFEEIPELHLIGAGSLVKYSLLSVNFRIPVGRIQYFLLYPLSFGEFFDALGESELRNYILNFPKLKKLPVSLHVKLNKYVRKYFIIGGTPAVVQEYVTTRDIIKCQRIQRSIIDTYIDDFAKYSKVSNHTYLRKVFNAVPGMVGQKFVYTQVDRTIKSRELKNVLELLETAGVVTCIRQTGGSSLPLAAGVHESIFKVLRRRTFTCNKWYLY